MARLKPLAPEELGELEDVFAVSRQRTGGYVLNAYATLAYHPAILRGVSGMARAILSPGAVAMELKALVGYVSSNAAGCRFCQAHQAQLATKLGVSIEKLKAAFTCETSPLFTDAERAALRIAMHGSITPNAVTDGEFDALKKHFNPQQIVEIVGVIALFGFMNRWNDTLKTDLESTPMAFVQEFFPELAPAQPGVAGRA